MNRLSGALLTIAIILGVAGLAMYSISDPNPSPVPDGLRSAQAPDLPSHPCGSQPPKDAFLLTLGDATLWFSSFPHTVVTVDGKPEFTIARNKDGSIAVDVLIALGTDQLARLHGATLQDNTGQLLLKRPSASEIIVLMPDGTPILQIDYVNDHSLRVTGHLAFGGHDFVIAPEAFMHDNRNIGNVCLGGDKQVDFAL